ncbi:hypothetical protein [Bradyrhizobium sp. 2S1]|uniref:hypothetical protein n=2 Tax=Bradyrhizobium TaxID=374 RepID=UPI0039C88C74
MDDAIAKTDASNCSLQSSQPKIVFASNFVGRFLPHAIHKGFSCKRFGEGLHFIHGSARSCQRVCPFQSTQKTTFGRCAMVRQDTGYMPRENPCAQCGKPIARPDWVEHSEGRTSFLWNCRACNYRFEAIAIYDVAQLTPLAA